MIGPERERGAALLTVLLLVAVMATVAAAALDRIGVGTRFVANAMTAGLGRSWLGMAEQLTATRIEDLMAQDPSQTLPGSWLDTEKSIDLPDRSVVQARLSDGSNCFNLNGLAQKLTDGRMVARPSGTKQFVALMTSLGIPPGDAAAIAAGATDYIDADSQPTPGGGEDIGAPSANRLAADPSELRLLAKVTDRHYRLLQPWICALPMAEPAPINVNTLRADQAPLLAMLAPGSLDLARARAAISSRPADGFGSVLSFWQSPALVGVTVPPESAEQVKLRTSFYRMTATVRAGNMEMGEVALFDARLSPVRLVNRKWGTVN